MNGLVLLADLEKKPPAKSGVEFLQVVFSMVNLPLTILVLQLQIQHIPIQICRTVDVSPW